MKNSSPMADLVKDPEEVRLVRSGNDYFNTLEDLIRSAKQVLYFQMYIFDEDRSGKRILEALKDAAKRGVRVYFLLDAFGSNNFHDKTGPELIKAGIHFQWFSPFFSKGTIHIGRRMHHKVIVVDHYTSLIGGINISDKYKGDENKTAWLDYAILVKGSMSLEAEAVCCEIMNKEFSLKLQFLKKKDPVPLPLPPVQLRVNDRLRGKHQISRSYTRRIRKARRSIVLLCSYFLPGTRIHYLLNKAAKRGVNVKIILTGIDDVPVLGMAARHLYGSFMKNGIEIYEWNRSVLHGKLALIDDEWATVGSFNLNHLSALSSIEMNVDVRDKGFVNVLKDHLKDILHEGCTLVNEEEFSKNRNFFTRFRDGCAYYGCRASMRFLGLFPKLFSFTRKGQIEF